MPNVTNSRYSSYGSPQGARPARSKYSTTPSGSTFRSKAPTVYAKGVLTKTSGRTSAQRKQAAVDRAQKRYDTWMTKVRKSPKRLATVQRSQSRALRSKLQRSYKRLSTQGVRGQQKVAEQARMKAAYEADLTKIKQGQLLNLKLANAGARLQRSRY